MKWVISVALATAMMVASSAEAILNSSSLVSTGGADAEQPVAAGVLTEGTWELEECFPDMKCASELLIGQAAVEGGKATMENLQSVSSTWPALIAACHGISHSIGITAGVAVGAEKAFTDGSPNCQFGYYHGILIGEAEKLGDDKTFAVRAPELCQILNTDFLSYSSCVHGIGHAAAVRAKELPLGASMCAELNAEERQWCVSGVAMEWSTTVAVEQAATGQLTKEEIRHICGKLLAIDQGSCYREIPGGWMSAARATFPEMLEWCASDPQDDRVAALCALGVGFSLSARTDGDPAGIKETCALSRDDVLAAYCSGGAAVIAFEMFESFDRVKALAVCPAMPVTWQEICNTHLGQTVEAHANVVRSTE